MKRILLILSLMMSLTACSTTRMSDAERLALFRAHAGEPVNSFRLFGSLNGWQPLGNTALVVWPAPNRAYLLQLMGLCSNLPFAHSISLSNQMGTVSARFDSVVPRGGGPNTGNMPCRIQEIRPIDVPALRETKREMREVQSVEREHTGDAE